MAVRVAVAWRYVTTREGEPVEALLNRILAILWKLTLGVAGAVTRTGIQRTHDTWRPYRAAFVALALAVRPESKREVWHAWLSADRLQLLQELAKGC